MIKIVAVASLDHEIMVLCWGLEVFIFESV